MARTDKLQQSQLELQAGQSGESARQRAHEGRTESRHKRVSQDQNQQRIDIAQQSQWDQQWKQRRADRDARDAERAKNQAGKDRTTNFGTEGRDPSVPAGPDPKLDETKRQFDASHAEKQRQFDQSQQLDAAKAGLQVGGGASSQDAARVDQALEQNPNDPRLLQMQQEMQRGNTQMQQGLEQKGKRGFVPTQDARQESGRKAGIEERETRAKEINAAANYQRAVTSYSKLQAEEKSAKTGATRSQIQAKKRAVEESLSQPLKSGNARMNRVMKGEATEADAQTLRAMIEGVPPVGNARATVEAIKAGNFEDPNVVRFMGEKLAADAVQYIYATGKLPDGKLVDLSSAGMQEFSRRAIEARQLLLPNTVAGQMLTDQQVNKVKRGYDDHLEMVHKLAALLVMKKKQAGEAMPNAALTPGQEPTHEQRRATDAGGQPVGPATPAERAGQINPAEAGRRAEEAGGRAAPATGKKPYVKPPRTGGMGTRGGLSGNLPYGV